MKTKLKIALASVILLLGTFAALSPSNAKASTETGSNDENWNQQHYWPDQNNQNQDQPYRSYQNEYQNNYDENGSNYWNYNQDQPYRSYQNENRNYDENSINYWNYNNNDYYDYGDYHQENRDQNFPYQDYGYYGQNRGQAWHGAAQDIFSRMGYDRIGVTGNMSFRFVIEKNAGDYYWDGSQYRWRNPVDDGSCLVKVYTQNQQGNYVPFVNMQMTMTDSQGNIMNDFDMYKWLHTDNWPNQAEKVFNIKVKIMRP